ncbi:hypothetical protein Scep_029514 [Stephania cephalantha]|uniref:Secreted protein n=1 Tax=Stephania cephalantha TaxID=152367 RepID=A0AAP0E146_9MAGN
MLFLHLLLMPLFDALLVSTAVNELLGSMYLVEREACDVLFFEGAVGVNGSHGFRNLCCSVSQGVFSFLILNLNPFLRSVNCLNSSIHVAKTVDGVIFIIILGSRIEANLAGSIVQLLGLVGDAITSAEANIFSV